MYPDPVVKADDAMEGNKSDANESLLQKVYVHTSIVASDNIVLDKEEDIFNEVRRDNNPHPQNTASPQNVPNLEQQVVNALKQFVAKSKMNVNNAPGGGMVTGNRIIRRRRVPLTGNRNGRMF